MFVVENNKATRNGHLGIRRYSSLGVTNEEEVKEQGLNTIEVK